MSEHHGTPIDELVENSSKKGKDHSYRRLLLFLLVLWLITFAGLVGFAWNAYFQKKQQVQTLAEQITLACKKGDFGPGLSKTDEDNLCHKAEKVASDNSVSIGIQGPRGPQGPQGIPGIQGPTGMQGLMGVKGQNGKNGLNGLDGLMGPIGPAGPVGPKGDTGEQGPKGDTGPQGPSGLVAFTTVGCDGPVIQKIVVSYDPKTQTATITCN